MPKQEVQVLCQQKAWRCSQFSISTTRESSSDPTSLKALAAHSRVKQEFPQVASLFTQFAALEEKMEEFFDTKHSRTIKLPSKLVDDFDDVAASRAYYANLEVMQTVHTLVNDLAKLEADILTSLGAKKSITLPENVKKSFKDLPWSQVYYNKTSNIVYLDKFRYGYNEPGDKMLGSLVQKANVHLNNSKPSLADIHSLLKIANNYRNTKDSDVIEFQSRNIVNAFTGLVFGLYSTKQALEVAACGMRWRQILRSSLFTNPLTDFDVKKLPLFTPPPSIKTWVLLGYDPQKSPAYFWLKTSGAGYNLTLKEADNFNNALCTTSISAAKEYAKTVRGMDVIALEYVAGEFYSAVDLCGQHNMATQIQSVMQSNKINSLMNAEGAENSTKSSKAKVLKI